MSKAILNYENVDDSLEIEIFGLNFKIVFSEEYSIRLDEIQKEIKEKSKTMTNSELISKFDAILGSGAVEKIKNKYLQDRGYEIGTDTWTTIYLFVIREIENHFDSNHFVKSERPHNNIPNYNRNYRRNNHYRR